MGYEWVIEEEEGMSYTEVLKEFLQNYNQKWLTYLLTVQMIAKCKFSHNTDVPTFRILRAKPMQSSTIEFANTYGLLKSWGIFELSYIRHFQDMNIIAAYEVWSRTNIVG
jgi:hypothetical protein